MFESLLKPRGPQSRRPRATANSRSCGVRMEPLEGRQMFSATLASALVYAPTQKVAGETQAQYSADWWKWAFSITASKSVKDTTGQFAAEGFVGKAFFLEAVGFGGPTTVTRNITVGSDTPIFFPVLNAIADNSEPPPIPNDNFTEAQLRSFAAFFVGADTTPPGNVMHASLDATDIPNLVSYRELSPAFTYTVPLTDNLWQNAGANITQPAPPAVSDGYWVMLKPLSPGQHTLHFTGSVGNTGFSVDETYHITIVPQGQNQQGQNQQGQNVNANPQAARESASSATHHKTADEEVLGS